MTSTAWRARLNYIRNILCPCLLLSAFAGTVSGVLIFAFKFVSSYVIGCSEKLYEAVRLRPSLLPLLLGGSIVLGCAAALTLRFVRDCRGGGIPTAIAMLRGLVHVNWIKSIVFVFWSAMMTYFGGVPLGNEGPSVQMGAAVGRGTVRVFARKNRAWDRYIMTGGACAGFAAATGSPLAGIFFALEEAHRRFSPMLFMTASVTVVFGTAVMRLLCIAAGIPYYLFHFATEYVLPIHSIWAPLVIGAVSGAAACIFTRVYRAVRTFIRKRFGSASLVVVTLLFFVVALVGFFSEDCIGSGHSLVEKILEGEGVWYLLLLVFAVRALLLMTANSADVTGGLFVPTLAFGAVIGGVCGRALVAAGLLSEEAYPLLVIIGIAAFLGCTNHAPVTALVFAAEAFSGINNMLPIAAGVAIAFLVVETLGMPDLTEAVIEGKIHNERTGKTPHTVDAHVTVMAGSFAVGKEIRDILWPTTCTVLSVHRNANADAVALEEGDRLHLHYQSYDLAETEMEIESIVGRQTSDTDLRIRVTGENHQIPDV